MTSQQPENEEPSDDEQPTTSKPLFLFGPQAINFVMHNPITILDAIDVNSADDVRQAFKAANAAEKEQQQEENPPPEPEADNQPLVHQESDLALSPELEPEARKEEDQPAKNTRAEENTDSQGESKYASGDNLKRRNSAEIEIHEGSNNSDSRTNNVAGPSRKRGRSRSPKAGPSKKRSRTTSTEFFRGKLSNYVSFASDSDSDSDLDSCIYYR